MITPEERYTHPQRNRIYKSLGGEEQVELDIFTQRLRPGMRLLLCSDGLWEMTRDPEIEQILRTTESPYAACAALIASANEHGGEDNITAVLVQIDA
jgi:PPM family protein phosphatase